MSARPINRGQFPPPQKEEQEPTEAPKFKANDGTNDAFEGLPSEDAISSSASSSKPIPPGSGLPEPSSQEPVPENQQTKSESPPSSDGFDNTATERFASPTSAVRTPQDEVQGPKQVPTPNAEGIVYGDVHIDSPEDLAQLAGVKEIVGNLAVAGDIKDLAGLKSLERVHGDLVIGNGGIVFESTALTSLDGLRNLRRVDGDLLIQNIGELEAIDLPGLQRVEGILSVRGRNPNVSRVSLGKLKSAGGVTILGGSSLRSIDMPELERVDGQLCIGGGSLPPLYDHLDNLIYPLDEPDPIVQIELPALQSVGQLSVHSFSHLRSLSMPELQSAEYLDLTQNERLTNLSLPRFTNVGLLHIADNASLESLDGLSALRSIGDEIRILFNESLHDLSGLYGITSLCERIVVRSNFGLDAEDIDELLRFLKDRLFTGETEIDDNGP